MAALGPAAMPLSFLIPVAALAAQPAVTGPLPALTLEQETAVRCASAFAIVAAEQAKGGPSVANWPGLGARGREFFVRTGARLMDDTGASRPAVSALFARSADDLRAGGQLAARLEGLRQPCLALLDLTVPAG
ncbi:hypothetical protein B0I00_2055 [Novosphingobium kunmingense]|uniref:Uncharacterized protein n=2 Tax=Novosphingobium kunmingense TaxID=1211806 RepID=A0A2N0H6C4_9SPHN|nr:hypothetical protein B0I00_2055 [Novosphingobium kunmingense]